MTPELATVAASQEPARDKKRKKPKADPAATIAVSVIPVEVAEEVDPTAYDPQTVSVTSCLVVMSSFVIGGAILFSVWEVTKPILFFLLIFSFLFEILSTANVFRAGAMWTDPISVSPVY